METDYAFPFGETVSIVQQIERSPKKIFMLGVYASAVHARWVDTDGKTKVTALAVASEPYIFWHGNEPERIIDRIPVPSELGTLLPAAKNLNGPSGRALDEHFLAPLRISRADAWLCDLVPHSCLNPGQQKAIKREYTPLIEQFNLPPVTLPPVPKRLTDEARRNEIVSEIEEANPEILVLLGDEPIRWFLAFYDQHWKKLSDFGETIATYGRLHHSIINGHEYKILPLVHPRQAARLGGYSKKWYTLHQRWLDENDITFF